MEFKDRYQYNPKIDLLGRGGFALVYKAHDTLLNRFVALKFFNNSGGNKHTLIQEISRVISLEHPNLCRYYDAAVLEFVNLHGETENTEVGVMEYIDSGELKPYLVKNPQHMDKLLTDVLQGLGYLHGKGIIHRDLKPQNILIKSTESSPIAKITDFGISRTVSTGATSASQLMGTVEYMAPEQFNPAKYGINGRIGTNLDLWSFGLMIYELITGETMFGTRGGQSSAEQVMSNILNEDLVEEKIQKLPAKYYKIASRCLVKDAKARVQNAVELIALLNSKAESNEEVKAPQPESRGADTVVLPKNFVNLKQQPPVNDDTPTQVIRPVEVKPVETKLPPIKPVQIRPVENYPVEEKYEAEAAPEVNKRNNVLLYVILLLLISVLGAWYFFSHKKSQPDDYHYALLHFGDTTTQFLPRLIKASKEGNDSASLKLAGYYFEKARFDDALSALQPLVVKNDTAAINLQGRCQYKNGMSYSGRKDYASALNWFAKGAAAGNAPAQCMLGNMYYMGRGVDVDFSKALQWYSAAAEKRNEVAIYGLGLIYTDGGNGVLKNIDKAKKSLQWVIDSGKNEELKKRAINKLQGLQ